MERRKRKRRGSERTRDGSERTRDGSERNQHGSERNQHGSERNQHGSECTRHESEGVTGTPDLEEEEEFDLAARFMEPRDGWWFDSLGEYVRYSETGPDRPTSLSARPKKSKIAAPNLPAGAAPEKRHSRHARTRQISIRLGEEDYEALVKVASTYGVAPATMGRLLVVKGAQKAVEGG
jgi:hypothetical protein